MLSLPATPADCLSAVIIPALGYLPGELDSPEARVMLLAVALQESGLRTRVQDNSGPARGFWQFERGGVIAVLDNSVSMQGMRDLCRSFAVAPIPSDVYYTLTQDDVFACGVARWYLRCDPHPLAELGDADDAWLGYQVSWGPGQPKPEAWAANYGAALAAVRG